MFEHRLLFLSEIFPPSRGGIQSYLAGLLRELPPRATFVVASTSRGDSAWDAAQPFAVSRVPTSALAYPRWRHAWTAARRIVREKNIEAVVCGKTLFEGRAARRLRREFGVPYVVLTYGRELRLWQKDAKAARDLRAVLREASRVVVINAVSHAEVRALGVSEVKIVRLAPGIPGDFFVAPEDLNSFRARHRIEKKRVLVSVARLVPRKGTADLLAALPALRRAHPDVVLLLVGDGPERRTLEVKARAHGLAEYVRFLGEVPDGDLRCALAVADCFVLTPRELPDDPEGFGIVYLEASALGKPSVASRTGGVPEAVSDGETGILVPPGDITAIAEALDRLLADDAFRQRLGAAARDRARLEFHWRGRALLFQAMLHSVVNERTDDRRVDALRADRIAPAVRRPFGGA